ncbi:MAG: SRPBCC family protein [Actinomycetota bacterium]|nr:SRPBCC family protein [Actinomycetota bacterium]
MTVQLLDREQFIGRPVAEVFEFFSLARNLEELTPPWLGFEVLTPEPIEMHVGALIRYRLRVHSVPLRWVTRIERWERDKSFVDRQLRGPYRLWHHLHEFTARDGGTLVRDRVHYALPLGPLGTAAHRLFVHRDLQRIFAFRHEAVQRLIG